ncbi:hypothetical protein BE11_02970 [Sorangium cellulosum]|nr:hypothetical protein BE11_02970 [Sorangium cellulosum]
MLLMSLVAILLAGSWRRRSSPLAAGAPASEKAPSAAQPRQGDRARRNTAARPPRLLDWPVPASEPRLPWWPGAPQPVGEGTLMQGLRAFREGVHNAFFDAQAHVARWLSVEPTLPWQLEALLAEIPRQPLRELADVDSPPEEVLERMSALDVLEALAREPGAKDAAEGVLARIARRPLPEGLDDAVKRNVLVEAMEAEEALCRLNLRLCVDSLGAVERAPLRSKLAVAALRGMIEAGVTAEDARRLVAGVGATLGPGLLKGRKVQVRRDLHNAPGDARGGAGVGAAGMAPPRRRLRT